MYIVQDQIQAFFSLLLCWCIDGTTYIFTCTIKLSLLILLKIRYISNQNQQVAKRNCIYKRTLAGMPIWKHICILMKLSSAHFRIYTTLAKGGLHITTPESLRSFVLSFQKTTIMAPSLIIKKIIVIIIIYICFIISKLFYIHCQSFPSCL